MGSLHIDPVTAVLGLLLALLCGAVLFVYRTVKSLPPITKVSLTQRDAWASDAVALAAPEHLTDVCAGCAGSGGVLPSLCRWWWWR